jgi:uncharacterized caspase-like protein
MDRRVHLRRASRRRGSCRAIIGNGAYPAPNALPNPPHDAATVKDLLEGLGFRVVGAERPGAIVRDASRAQMFAALARFQREAEGAQLALIYYAGHGLEVGGANYLLPVDASLLHEEDLEAETLPLENILTKLKDLRVGARMLILDCCRNNPLTRSWLTTRSEGSGLKEVKDTSFPPATMIMFAAAPGQQALDGADGGNSPFTKALREQLAQTGVSAFDAFMRVSDAVAAETSERQTPWVRFDGAGRDFRKFNLATGAPVLVKLESVKPAIPDAPPPATDRFASVTKRRISTAWGWNLCPFQGRRFCSVARIRG